MSPRVLLPTGFLLVIAVAVTVIYFARPTAAPQINGVLLQPALALPEFQLRDHHNRAFTTENLKGRWHLVSYGFTTCPDICPTTLSQLAVVTNQLEAQGFTDLDVLFYTVDPQRDTVSQLASYVPFFDPGFLGLTHTDNSNDQHLPFEESLGIYAQLIPLTGPEIDPAANEYQVNHGATLFLINPEGELQAIFQPDIDAAGIQTFNPENLLHDYLAIRDYLG